MELTKTKYKKTEVGIIPMDWLDKGLKDISTLITKGTTPHKFSSSGVNYIKIESLLGDSIDLNRCLFIEERIHNGELKRSILNENDILFAIAGATIGKLTIVNKEIIPANTNQALAIIRLNKEQNIKYVFFVLKSFLMQKYILDNIAGGAQPNLNLEQIGNFRFALPHSKEEQNAISTALSDIDDLINNLEKLINKKKNIKRGVIQELFKPKNNWKNKPIRELAKYRRGSFPQPYGLPKWYDSISGTPFVQVVDVDDNKKLKSETKARISNEGEKFSVFVPKGTIILTIQGSIGRICITDYDAYVDRTLLIFESILEDFNKYFFMMSIFLKFEIEKEKAPGGIIKTITKEALSSFEISYPDVNEQNKIAEIIQSLENEVELLSKKLDKYYAIKQGMMQELLTGKTRLI
jgi:type I restriction enzyme S subunit